MFHHKYHLNILLLNYNENNFQILNKFPVKVQKKFTHQERTGTLLSHDTFQNGFKRSLSLSDLS